MSFLIELSILANAGITKNDILNYAKPMKVSVSSNGLIRRLFSKSSKGIKYFVSISSHELLSDNASFNDHHIKLMPNKILHLSSLIKNLHNHSNKISFLGSWQGDKIESEENLDLTSFIKLLESAMVKQRAQYNIS